MRDKLRYDTKLLMSYNLTRIIELKDENGICERELSLNVPIDEYYEIMDRFNFISLDQMELLYEKLQQDNAYLKEYKKAV